MFFYFFSKIKNQNGLSWQVQSSDNLSSAQLSASRLKCSKMTPCCLCSTNPTRASNTKPTVYQVSLNQFLHIFISWMIWIFFSTHFVQFENINDLPILAKNSYSSLTSNKMHHNLVPSQSTRFYLQALLTQSIEWRVAHVHVILLLFGS